MLKITELSPHESYRILKLEGKLLSPWVNDLRNACSQFSQHSVPTSLDLVAVTFVDAAGADLLRELIRQGITIARCSSFVAELLHQQEK